MQVDQKQEASAAPEAGPSEPVPSSSSAPPPTTSSSTTNGTTPAVNGAAVVGDVEMGDSLPEGASEVIYINNLNEKIKLDGSPSPSALACAEADVLARWFAVMKQSLKTLFKQYGNVLDVVAHRSIRMRGQAFVTLDSKDAAAKAVAEVKGFPLYGKPMVSLCCWGSYDGETGAAKENGS